MEFTLDLLLVRGVLERERRRVREQIRDLGMLGAFAKSQPRHDAASPKRRMSVRWHVDRAAHGASTSPWTFAPPRFSEYWTSWRIRSRPTRGPAFMRRR